MIFRMKTELLLEAFIHQKCTNFQFSTKKHFICTRNYYQYFYPWLSLFDVDCDV